MPNTPQAARKNRTSSTLANNGNMIMNNTGLTSIASPNPIIKRKTFENKQQANQVDTQAFVETIISFAKNLESEKISVELQNLFLRYAEQNTSSTLPAGSKPVLIDQFLTIAISLITYNQHSKVATRSLRILFEYLKNGKLRNKK